MNIQATITRLDKFRVSRYLCYKLEFKDCQNLLHIHTCSIRILLHIPFSNTVNIIQSIINKTRRRKENAKAKRKVKQTRCESCYRRNEKRCLLLGALHLPVPYYLPFGGNTHIQIYVCQHYYGAWSVTAL